MTRVMEWSDPPQMDTGAPMPGIYCGGDKLVLAYIVSAGPPSEYEEYAVVKFSGVLHHTFGYPSDETLGTHPLYKLGLSLYAFNVISDSPVIHELGARNATVFPGSESMYRDRQHWIVPFHDETLEVVGQSAEVVGRVEARNAHGAIRWYLERPGVAGQAGLRSLVEN